MSIDPVESSAAAARKSSMDLSGATAECRPAYVRHGDEASGAAGGSVRSPFITTTALAGQQELRRRSPPSPAAGPDTKRARNGFRERASGIESESSTTAHKSTDGHFEASFRSVWNVVPLTLILLLVPLPVPVVRTRESVSSRQLRALSKRKGPTPLRLL